MTPPNKQVKVVVIRNKVEKTLNVKVGEAPDALASTGDGEKPPAEKLGFSVANITPQDVEKYKLDKAVKGVLVTDIAPDCPAAMEGLDAGMVILKVNGVSVTTTAGFDAATKDLKSGDAVRLIVKTTQRQALITFEVE
jgi:serine protease Do